MKLPQRLRLVTLCALCLSLWTAASFAQTSNAFLPMGDFDILVGGEVDSAGHLYQNQAMAAILVVSDRLPSPVVVHARSRGVQAVPRERLSPDGEGFTIVRGNPLASLGTFEVEGTEVVFDGGDGTQVRLRPRPPLVGPHHLNELLEHDPGYRVGAEAYEPDPAVIARLREVQGDFRVQVVFGSWCSVCKHFLPHGLRVEEEIAGSSIRFDYFGLPLDNAWEQAKVKELGVRALPTAIVYYQGKEIGRYIGAEGWERPESRLLELVSSAR